VGSAATYLATACLQSQLGNQPGAGVVRADRGGHQHFQRCDGIYLLAEQIEDDLLGLAPL